MKTQKKPETEKCSAPFGRYPVFACLPDNDLYRAVGAAMGGAPQRREVTAEAIALAPENGAVAILADGYPEKQVSLDAALFEQAAAKNIRIYLEYPAALPGLDAGAPARDKFLRGVVVSKFFGEKLASMRIVAVNGCAHVPVKVDNPHMVLARVAGVDTAVFGLANTPSLPLLFEHARGNLLVATTKLSQFATGRYMPAGAWRTIWETILAWLVPGVQWPELRWQAAVRPSFNSGATLPSDAGPRALRRVADWMLEGRVFRHAAWPAEVLDRSLKFNNLRERPGADCPCGDGSLGVLEGFSSTIHADGSQPMRYAVRFDCVCETAMLMAFDAAVNKRPKHAGIAGNLLDYGLLKSELAVGGQRANPESPSFGLMSWALDSLDTYWGDDNARALLAALAVAALRKERRWSDAIARCLLANLRLTGVNGHRRRCLKESELQENGWQFYWREKHIENTLHMQAWLPACYLWAYTKTGFKPFLARSQVCLKTLMEAYPGGGNG